MVYWYNVAPRDKLKTESVPSSVLHTYTWRLRDAKIEDSAVEEAEMMVGDSVHVKPQGARCTSRWPIGKVTAVNSATNIDVDGVPS